MTKLMRRLAKFILLSAALLLPAYGQASVGETKEVKTFIKEMVTKHGFDKQQLQQLFATVKIRDDIIAAISRPAESKPWHQYRPIFVTDARTNGGLEFYKKHEATLKRAEQTYGVPAEIIVAIIGVETRYGQNRGSYPVLDSLSTLAFHYPKRARFFRSELESYLLMTREEQLDPASIKGSYAGAMGHPQFIASSYREYAIDFSGDGQRDLINSPVDAIGSVANYFKRHGWQTGQPIAAKATASPQLISKYSTDLAIKPSSSLKQWQILGVTTPHRGDTDAKATLLALEGQDGTETWLGFDNFYVITRYNHSALYAMAVYQLSEQIKAAKVASVMQHDKNHG